MVWCGLISSDGEFGPGGVEAGKGVAVLSPGEEVLWREPVECECVGRLGAGKG